MLYGMTRLLQSLLLIAGLMAMPGCATFLANLEPPEIGVINVLPLEAEGTFEQRAKVELRIINPNDFDLQITGISFQLDINDRRFTRGVSNESFTVPRLGEAKTSLVVSTTVLDILRQVMALDERQQSTYAISGKVYLGHARMRSLSFKHTGDLAKKKEPSARH